MTKSETDNPRALGESKAFTNAREDILIWLLCFAAAPHVLIFSAAFPFFSNVDEYLHFDLITQYSQGQVPGNFNRLRREALDWIVPYASPEFLSAPEQFREGKFPTPLWKQSGAERESEIAATRAAWSDQINFGKCVVVDWEARWSYGASIVVLDSIPECSAGRDCRMGRLSHRTQNRAGAYRIAFGCAVAPCFHSSECLLHNQQRCVVACVFWRAVPSTVAMAGRGDTLNLARPSHRIGHCSDLSNKALKFAIHRSRGAGDYFKTAANHVANARKGIGHTGRSSGLCRDSNRQLDGMEQSALR